MPGKILILVSSMGSGGAERTASNMANYWSSNGHDVTLVITSAAREECFFFLSSNVNIVYLADLCDYEGKGILTYWSRLCAMRRFLKNLSPQVILSFLPQVNVLALLSSLKLGHRVIVSERTYPPMLPLGFFWETLRKITYPLADHVVMQTSEGLRWLLDSIPRASGAVIANSVQYPLPPVQPFLRPDDFISLDRKLLLAVGRLDSGKQFDCLIKAFSVLADRYPQWDLVVLGEGAARSELEALVAAFNLGTRVYLPGRAGNVGDWYERADIYAMSSRFEGFPNTLTEAMSYGCAVLSYDCETGPRDIIRDGHDGLLVRPVGSVEALAASMMRLMENDHERKLLASRAVNVRERYSTARIFSAWEELLKF